MPFRSLLQSHSPRYPGFLSGHRTLGLSLVDPDNRRPVDFSMRAKLLNELERTCMDIGEDRRGFVRDLIDIPNRRNAQTLRD